MPALEFPRHHLGLLQELVLRLLDSRKPGTTSEALARDLLTGFHDTCMRVGLDRVLVELEQAFPPLDIADRAGLAEHPTLLPALVAQLGTIPLDDGGPRSAKPRMLADGVVAALGLTLADEADRTIALDGAVLAEVTAALASVVDVELAVPQIRDSIVAKGRELCEPRYHSAFDRIAAQLDERGMRMIKQPKVPLDAVQAVQRVLFEARNAIIDRVARAAIDRAKEVIARANPDAAARIDLPITHRLTPREVAVFRACDARVPKVAESIAHSLLESLTQLSPFAWRAPERPVRAYAASQTFAVGDLLEHPKFGRGSVISCLAQRIEVEFADGLHTLVHVRGK
ncbi:MAG: hypothetical protein H0T79_15455 [Deltaproteobacteria bacterium]|nr:hypothetical protein [Deltaproteobacteria bacterium]